MMRRAIVIAIILVVSGCTASVGTLLITRDFHSQGELERAPMGWPFTFVYQDLSGYTPMTWPQSFRFDQPQDHPVSVHLGWFGANVLVWSAAIWVVISVVLRVRARRGR